MEQTRRSRIAFVAGFAVAFVGGMTGYRYMTRAQPAFVLEQGEELRDAVRALPPTVPPSAVAPSRVAMWASPALRRAEMDKALLSSRRARGVAP